MMLFSEEVPCSENGSKCVLDFESKIDELPSDSCANDVRRSTDFPTPLTQLLAKHSHTSPPLIPNDVACTLLRIQSKFLDEHPCLCTSRFRRTLHQLDKESHLKLDKLCNDLQILDLESYKDAGEVRNFYTHFLPTVFDFHSLQLYVTPDISPEESFKIRTTSSEGNSQEEPDKKREILILRLESILARFVSDYRAIFAIEGKCKHDDDFTVNHSIVDHEHRKRHDEEDVCPDEIKLMKVACAELTLECSSSSSSSKTVSPVETPKKGKRPKSLSITASSTANTINNNAVESTLEPDKDHHIHRYYSFLRSQHTSRKGSHHHHHTSKDSNNSSRASLNQPSNIHCQQNHYGQQAPSPSRSFLGPAESKELSPGPLKWSPSIAKSTSVFKFYKNSTGPESAEMKQPENVDSTSNASIASNASDISNASNASQRKRKDTRTNSEHTDSKKMSRSSSNILEEKTKSEVCSNLEMEEILRRSKSYCEVSFALKNIEHDFTDFGKGTAEVKKPEPPKGTCMFYVSDEEITLPNPSDEPDYVYSNTTSRFATDDSNGSLNARFNRDLEFGGRKSGHSGHSRSRLKYRRSRSRIEQPEMDESKSYSGGENKEKSLSYDELEISSQRELDQGDSFESSLSSSPSSCTSSITSDAGHLGEVEEDEDEKDDDVTIKEDTATSPTKLTFPQLRRASWENIEPAIQDHQQQLDTLEPVIMSWMPQIGLRRESSSSMSSDTDEFSTRHVKILQKHSDPSHIQRLLTDDATSKRSKLKYLGKQLKSLKHTMNDLEMDFEMKHGYKPSHVDKQNNDLMRRVLTDQYRIRKQIQICKESDSCLVDPGSNLTSDDSFESLQHNESTSYQTMSASQEKSKMLETMSIYFNSLVQTIKSQRILSGRPYSFDEMTTDQLLDEKKELKSALFRFAETFGHPDTDEVKNLTRDVHDRYLFVKRLIRKNSANFRAKESSELETIPEDLEIPLTLASPQHRINIEVTSISIERSSEVRPSFKCQSSSLKIIEENLHAMSRYELLEIQQRTRDEKKHYRRIIKEKEEKYLKDNVLRRIPKDEKSKIDEINYNLYKKAKAKLKLIEALLSKGRQ